MEPDWGSRARNRRRPASASDDRVDFSTAHTASLSSRRTIIRNTVACLLTTFLPILSGAFNLSLAGEPPAAPTQETAAPATATPATGASGQKEWSYSASAFGYLFLEGGEGDFIQPTVRADRGSLRLEARYNYEDRDTGSFWGGWINSFGQEVSVELTPILGAVVGQTDGIAPGLELDLTWKSLSYYTESEYVFDFADHESNFFYAWSELSWQATDWFRTGLVAQRTRVYQTDREVELGALAGFSFGKMELGTYFFNPGRDDRFAVLALSYEF